MRVSEIIDRHRLARKAVEHFNRLVNRPFELKAPHYGDIFAVLTNRSVFERDRAIEHVREKTGITPLSEKYPDKGDFFSLIISADQLLEFMARTTGNRAPKLVEMRRREEPDKVKDQQR